MLSGHLPNAICASGLLKQFGVANNFFSGPVPKSIKNCSSLKRVRLQRNQLTGNNSEDFGIYPELDYMDLSNNNFYGEVSSNWGHCPNLTSLQISNNNLSGKISTGLGGATRLFELHLSSNHFVGEIPKSFKRLSSLTKLYLDDNNLYGSLPSELGNLYNLELSLAKNSLSGPINENIGECLKLRSLNLSTNKFEGFIPVHVSKLEKLETLDLRENNLTRSLPSQLGGLKILQTLNLSHNNLTGSIPSGFTEMLSLTIVDVSFNQLEGPLPKMRAFEEALTEALGHNKRLCGNNIGLECPIQSRNQGSLRDVLNHMEQVVEFDWKKRVMAVKDSSNWTSFAGTFGYAAPVIMGMHPGDLLASSQDLNGISLYEILDQRLAPPDEQIVEQVESLVKVAFSCLHPIPNSRPSMRNIALGFSVEEASRNMKVTIVTEYQAIDEEKLPKMVFRTRILIDVSKIDMTTTILGFKISMPIMLTPTVAEILKAHGLSK
ncbi:hypothetical protein L1987_77454 [Smallanthus sonchifolius]|uniref:Uncharacterized protein n=1 Tax=Smallanthus sonchifolius TaxID=185202 RepID=A0ACB8ZA07_9ASTR|nr:hypothetical protein L1987_77454 [Smallanthus sonchifolius]